MHTYPRTTLAITLLAAGWIGSAVPAFADQTAPGVNDLRAAYQAEGRGATAYGNAPSTDVAPTVTSHVNLGGAALATQTDAGLAQWLGVGGQGAAGPAPAAAASGNVSAGLPASSGGMVGGYPQIAPLHESGGHGA